ncbi:Collagen alpha-1(XXVII) chain [Rhizoctonia solani]|uniref:Collagen alpha-1(XXVII) chain n=1 Tax=Rhizoctonia solani TaxID=456999 RepID=A0A0K6G965_9AGAM|nr:Collagen alpha-1(XXVII) chain [Rhizoctonia solani]
MVSGWQNGDWIETVQHSRLTDSASPQSERSSNATAIQEPALRPPAGGQPPPQVSPNQGFPQRYTSLPASPLDQNTGHKDTRTLTDPITHDHFLLFPPATLAEQASLPKLPPGNTANSASDLSSRHPAELALYRPISLETSPQPKASSPPTRFAQALWDNDPVKPGTVLFSTGPIMSKPPSGQPPNADPTRRSSADRTLWTAPSGVPSSKPSSDTALTQERDVVHSPGYQSDAPSLFYTTGHPTNTASHTGYAVGYPSYPGTTPFGPSSPRHPSFAGPPNTSSHVQSGTYPNAGSGHVYPNYRPGMPYSPYTPYQSGSGFNQYPTSPPAFGPMPGNFPSGFSAPSPAASGYPTSPSAGNYQGSSVAGGYPSPTGAYGMHFAPYGMVSAPPMYAPATYAHAPYGHPYLPPQGHADEGPTSGMWWFMPAGSSSGSNTTQSAGTYGAQPQTQIQFLQRFAGSQQPLQSIPTMLNASSPNPQQMPTQAGFPPPPAAHSPTASLPSMATAPTPSTASPHQMYASFGAMSLQSTQPPAGRQPPPLVMPTHTHPAPPSATGPQSASVQSPIRPTSTSKGRSSATSKAGPGGSRVTSPATRRPWHPNPPIARSDWVMWVGNVPSDATHDELWSFFNQDTTAREPIAPTGPGRTLLSHVPAEKDIGAGTNTEPSHGVSSVFLISRSNCAFVNYDEEVYLGRSVSFFNGRPLRPQDPRCPRLVCRVRRKDDDLRAGVGGQRGMGMHARWVQEQERRAGEATTSGTDGIKDKDTVDDPATSPSTYLGAASSSGSSPPVPAPVDDAHKLPADLLGTTGDPKDLSKIHHSGSGSTNSSFLSRNFPKRYFILKSLTQIDLNISVDRGLWATQPHNESTLDRAYRTSKDVYLIFSANKSGEWFGYARMEGPIINSQQSVSWESRVPSKSPTSPTIQRKPEPAADGLSDGTETGRTGSKLTFFSPSEHKFAASPAPITPGSAFPVSTRVDGQTSAPPEMTHAHKALTNPSDGVEPDGNATSSGIFPQQDAFELDQSAPYRAARALDAFTGSSKEQVGTVDGDGVVHRDTILTDDLEHARGLSEDPGLRPIRETLGPLSPEGEKTRPKAGGNHSKSNGSRRKSFRSIARDIYATHGTAIAKSRFRGTVRRWSRRLDNACWTSGTGS